MTPDSLELAATARARKSDEHLKSVLEEWETKFRPATVALADPNDPHDGHRRTRLSNGHLPCEEQKEG